MDDFTTVVGVDKKHLEQLLCVLPTWVRFKPSLFKRPMLIFYDASQLEASRVMAAVSSVIPVDSGITYAAWSPDVDWGSAVEGRLGDAQRHKMLAGFVHLPSDLVRTRYWLKLDTDVVARRDDEWVDPMWFAGNAIVSHRWGYTKPPDQMLKLDAWVDSHPVLSNLADHPALQLRPNEGSSLVRHPRIISWCAFFRTEFTRTVAQAVRDTTGVKLPVPSQDGLMWYAARRLELPIQRVSMKSRGWDVRSSTRRLKQLVKEVMEE